MALYILRLRFKKHNVYARGCLICLSTSVNGNYDIGQSLRILNCQPIMLTPTYICKSVLFFKTLFGLFFLFSFSNLLPRLRRTATVYSELNTLPIELVSQYSNRKTGFIKNNNQLSYQYCSLSVCICVWVSMLAGVFVLCVVTYVCMGEFVSVCGQNVLFANFPHLLTYFQSVRMLLLPFRQSRLPSRHAFSYPSQNPPGYFIFYIYFPSTSISPFAGYRIMSWLRSFALLVACNVDKELKHFSILCL